MDASKSGLGATLLQNDHPIAMASKLLNSIKLHVTNVMKKERLAICFGCQKFPYYIFGKKKIIQTDYKPLMTIMNKPIYYSPECKECV